MMTASLLALAGLTLIQLLANAAPVRGQVATSGLVLALAGVIGWGRWPGAVAGLLAVAALASWGWTWRQRRPARAWASGGTLLLAAALSPWVGARVAVAAVLVIGGELLWASQRHWRVRGLAGALVLVALVGLWLTHGVALLAVAATGCLAVLTLATLIARFLAQQDAVFAVSLDHMMAQYSQEVQSLYANMRGWRHDYHDHLQALKAYLDTLEDKLDTVDTLVHSGDPVLDAIVNAKLTLAERAQIPTNVKVFVGTQPLIDDLDLVVIVGNLLDNALEAIEAQPAGELRRLRVYIAILKQQLYISVTNTRPADQQIDVQFASTKNDKRGLGIRRINQLVARYGGVINRQYEDAVFVTEIAIPLTRPE